MSDLCRYANRCGVFRWCVQRWLSEDMSTCCTDAVASDQTAKKGKRLWHASPGVTFSTQDTKHRLRSYLDSLLNVNVFLQMRRICWRSFSITPRHLSHHLCSVLYNKALFQEHEKKRKAPSLSCFYVILPASNYGGATLG